MAYIIFAIFLNIELRAHNRILSLFYFIYYLFYFLLLPEKLCLLF